MRSVLPVIILSLMLTVSACGDDGSGGGGAGTGGSPASGGGGSGTGGTASTGGAPEGGGGAASETFCAPGLPTVSFAADVQPILSASCAKTTCHAGVQPDAGLDLREGQAHGELLAVATTKCSGDRVRVVAGDPAESYLFDKVRGVDLCGTSKRMPPTPNPMLTQSELDVLEAWICSGALDD